MADAAAAARREARRRRILENSQSRLSKISGKTEIVEEASYAYPSIIQEEIPDQFPLHEEPTPIFTGHIHNGVHEDAEDALNNVYMQAVNDVKQQIDPAAPDSYTKRIISNKIDIVLLSFLVQFLYALEAQFVRNSYLFLPLLVLSFTKFYFFRSESSNGLIDTVLLMSGLQAHVIIYIKSILTLFEDVAIYLFTFVISQVVCMVCFG